MLVLANEVVVAQTTYKEFSTVQDALDWATANKSSATSINRLIISQNNDKSDILKLKKLNNNSGNGLYCKLEGVILATQSDTLPDNCFYDCYSGASWLTYFSAPQLKGIGNWSFRGCENLSEINVPAINFVGDYAFYHCAFTEVSLPASVNTIKANPFLGCKALQTITVDPANENFTSEEGVLYTIDKKTIISYPIGKISSSFVSPATVLEVGKNTFGLCENLVSMEFPSVNKLNMWAFEYCQGCTTIKFSSQTTINVEPEVFLNTITKMIDLFLDIDGEEYNKYIDGNSWKLYEWKSINNNKTSLKEITDSSGKFHIHLYPNPVTRVLCIDTDQDIRCITIYSMNSEVVFQTKETSLTKIDIRSLPKGFYVVEADSKLGKNRKLIIKK